MVAIPDLTEAANVVPGILRIGLEGLVHPISRDDLVPVVLTIVEIQQAELGQGPRDGDALLLDAGQLGQEPRGLPAWLGLGMLGRIGVVTKHATMNDMRNLILTDDPLARAGLASYPGVRIAGR